MKDSKKPDMDALILAGGKSSRMGGNHKGNLTYGEETFAERLIKEMKKVADKVWISYGESIPETYADCEIIMDQYKDCGPIGGIHAGLSAADAEIVAVAACDMPFLRAELFIELLKYLDEDADGVVPVTDGRIHPLAAIYKKRNLPLVEEKIVSRNYRLRDVLNRAKIRYVDVSEDDEMRKMLANINTVEEYREIGECHLR